MPARVLSSLVALVLLAGCVSGCLPGSAALTGTEPSAAAPPRRGPAAVEPARERPAVAALRLLRGWDRRRAAAYESGDVRGLRRLYAPASRAGARDLRILAGYADRGLVVDGLTMQVLRVRLLSVSERLVRLRVVDRVAGGTVVATGSGRSRTALPTGRPRERVVTLVDVGPRWVVRAVRRP